MHKRSCFGEQRTRIFNQISLIIIQCRLFRFSKEPILKLKIGSFDMKNNRFQKCCALHRHIKHIYP
ncbi:hypothetical protein HMPREF0653_01690 [Prevotella disiens JCM 6334 = ATCC 29426]|uniref:Uncharacterized protein n=1 Tax=Prevotella disiens JCM 6334 = ATCC 29426 TaxID=1235811 RepID=A0ABN0NRD5_9BACT|nr:hypothetical protein HMPREF0653_01690 [Prevotella disiens JCM 6334 = ATCC 29426]